MTDTQLLERRFAAIGARLHVTDGPVLGAPRIDVDDASGFELGFAGRGAPAEAEVIAIDPADRHLLLLVRNDGEKSKFLCGHDERHWFVAAIPESAGGVTGVETAKAALQPPIVAAPGPAPAAQAPLRPPQPRVPAPGRVVLPARAECARRTSS